MKQILLRYSLPAALLLGGALPVGFLLSFLVSGWLPGHHQLALPLQIASGLGTILVFGWLWGRSVARASGAVGVTRIASIAALTFFAVTLTTVQVLGVAENIFVENRALGPFPIHVVFAPLFTVAAFFVTAAMSLVVGGLLRGWRFGRQLAWRAGLAGAAAFLVADILQDLLGRRVGGPNAAATITMISVTMIGNLVAAFAAGTVMGWRLTHAAALTPTPAVAASESASAAPVNS